MLDTMGDATAVALVGLLSGLMLGLAARLGRFCTLGAIEDYFYSSSDLRLRMWGIAIGTAVTGSFVLIALGWLDPAAPIYLATAWSPVASVLGGLVFGYGMAISGNCGFGALARLGGGDRGRKPGRPRPDDDQIVGSVFRGPVQIFHGSVLLAIRPRPFRSSRRSGRVAANICFPSVPVPSRVTTPMRLQARGRDTRIAGGPLRWPRAR